MRWRKPFVTLIVVVFIAWLGVSALATWQLLHRARPMSLERPPSIPGLVTTRLTTVDGESLGAWFAPGSPEKPIVVVLHGHLGSRSADADLVEFLAADGEGVVAVTQRAHGDSSGDWCDVGWSSRNDAIAAVEFAEKQASGRPIVMLGTSMGAASAIFAARELGYRVSGYVLDSPYLSLSRAAQLRIQERLPPPFSWTAYLGLRLWSGIVLGTPLSAISPRDHLGDIPANLPVLLMRGDRDVTIPADDFAQLMAAAPQATVVQFQNCGHTTARHDQPEIWRTALLHTIQEVRDRENTEWRRRHVR